MAGQAEVEILRADRMPLPCPPTARLCREGTHCTNFAKRNAVASGALSAGRQAVYGIASGPMQGITRPLRPSLSFLTGDRSPCGPPRLGYAALADVRRKSTRLGSESRKSRHIREEVRMAITRRQALAAGAAALASSLAKPAIAAK